MWLKTISWQGRALIVLVLVQTSFAFGYPNSLSGESTSPQWVIKAMVAYEIQPSPTQSIFEMPCDNKWRSRWGFNGGISWALKNEELAAINEANPLLAKVEPLNAGTMILFKWNPISLIWLGEVICL